MRDQQRDLPSHAEACVVLAAHGAPATDYPRKRVGLLMALEFAGPAAAIGFLRSRKEALAREIRNWPRTGFNDPYKAAVEDLAARLAGKLGWPVDVGYNEFCSPTIDEAIDRAAARDVAVIIVVPTMLLRGNQHTEEEIMGAVTAARQRYPHRIIRYAWPFDDDLVGELFAAQIRRVTLQEQEAGS